MLPTWTQRENGSHTMPSQHDRIEQLNEWKSKWYAKRQSESYAIVTKNLDELIEVVQEDNDQNFFSQADLDLQGQTEIGYSHEALTIAEAEEILSVLDDFEETDHGLWSDLSMMEQFTCCAYRTYQNSVRKMLADFIERVKQEDWTELSKRGLDWLRDGLTNFAKEVFDMEGPDDDTTSTS